MSQPLEELGGPQPFRLLTERQHLSPPGEPLGQGLKVTCHPLLLIKFEEPAKRVL
jgi:hypothetical protein